MDAAGTTPDETTSLLRNQNDSVRGRDDSSSPVRRQRLLQKNVVLLILVSILLQAHLIFFSNASTELKIRRICYKHTKHHHPDRIGPGGKLAWFHCHLEEPVTQPFLELVKWEKLLAFIILLLVVVPYGKFADFRGKKKVITLALVGQLFSCLWTVAVGS
ncbi:hypothetical protein J7T55_003406 [Diaporthe amygdali]|uniref:uncharacterized protein n=1 Tax=Phomopsis amygdali TaxID=1214568 RepID=UPI0022FDDB5A|nr:uncharacterized protein J7T55_003406 [Diaporthe amygdali]KAJ0116991.1 hypothetical protein J7T55_003406 [Diaporthe amygdali]